MIFSGIILDMDPKNQVIVRMAPSPTGYFHIGSVRTALFNFLFAKKHGGTFIFRSEDTNDERSKKEFEDNILESLKWLGLSYDVFMRQSDRTEIYVSYLKKMIENGSAYISKEEPKEGESRSEVIRLKNPNKKIIFDDLVRGKVEFDTTESGDFVIAKSLTEPLYHLAVVVDDHETRATHIIRGEDILSSTPRQILIQEAIGANRPIYAHIPLILAPDRSKLSKRFGATSLIEYREKGFLPEAIINYMALLGWNPGTDKEIFTLNELIEEFDLARVQKGGAIFDITKLEWINKEHIARQSHQMQIENLKSQIGKTKWKDSEKWKDENFVQKFLKIILERIHRWGEVSEAIETGEFDYLFEKPELDKEKICWKGQSKENAKENLEKVLDILSNNIDDKEKIMLFAEEVGKGNALWPLRFSLSGKEKSPDPITLLQILGPHESRNRIQNAILKLEN